MQTGEVVSIDYVGRVKESGELFDTTKEDVAKEKGVHNPKVPYRPVDVVVGAGFVIKGLDDALKDMSVGDKKIVQVEPDNGFGQRESKLVRSIPLSNFKDQKINPTPGSYVNVNGVRGKIVSSDGGRIKVDFNHPLAGMRLEYDVEVREQVTDDTEKVRCIAGFVTGAGRSNVEAKIDSGQAEVRVKSEEDLKPEMKKRVADMARKWVTPVEKVRFVEEYEGGAGQ